MALRDRLSKAGVRVLTIDIETKPLLAYTWGIFKANIGINQIVEHGGLLCFAAKWVGEKNVQFYSEWNDGPEKMLEEAHRLLTEADIVVTYNGDRFDLKKLNGWFMAAGMAPPRPYKSIDLFKANKARFDFPSRKLDYLAQTMGVGSKTAHTGFQLWLDCMSGDSKAHKLMEKYNRQDVALTEEIYVKLLPWLPNPPHIGMFLPIHRDVCPHCGSESLRQDEEGKTVKAVTTTYHLRRCADCGAWSRTTERGRERDKLYTRSVK